MPNQLLKITNTVLLSPGIPGDPGDPGSPPVPGRCTTTTYNRPIWGEVLRNPGVNNETVLAVVGYETVSETTCTPSDPGRPARPPRDAVAPVFETVMNLGWSAGAISVEQLEGDGALAFEVPESTVGAVIGLNDVNVGTGFDEINYAWFVHGGYAAVMEFGVEVSAAQVITGASRLRVQRRGAEVTYWIDDTLVHTSATPSAGVMFADASLYSGGDAVNNAAWEPVVGTAMSAPSMHPMESMSADHEYAAGAGAMRPMTSSAQGDQVVNVQPSLHPLQSLASNYSYAATTPALHPLTAEAKDEADMAPSYSIGFGYMAPMVSWASGLTGESNKDTGPQSMHRMESLAADAPYAEARAVMRPATGIGAAFPPISNYIVTKGPAATVAAVASPRPPNFADLTGPRATLSAAAGHTVRATAPAPALTAAATGTNFARFNSEGPAATLVVQATTSGTVRANLTTSTPFEVKGYTGAVLSVTVGGATVEASAQIGAVSGIVATLPLFELSFSAKEEDAITAMLVGPMLEAIPSGVATLLGPSARLSAIGSAVVAVEYEAYAVNLKTTLKGKPNAATQVEAVGGGNEVSRYTNFPFTQIVRFGARYYGVAADGLYLLEGETDDGTPITWGIRTTTSDFDSSQRKTPVSCYIGGRMGPAATFTVHTGEKRDNSYAYSTPRGATAQNYRQPFGRGLNARYYAFEIEGDGELAIDDLDIEVNQLTRRI